MLSNILNTGLNSDLNLPEIQNTKAQEEVVSAPAGLENIDQNGKNGYITIENKTNTYFLTNLANMTAADCRHDFGINVITKGIDKQFSDALPVSVTQSPDEDGVLDSIITTTQSMPSFRAFLESITKDDSNGKDFDVKYINSGETYITTYNVFRYDGENYRKSDFDFANDFTQKSNLFLQTNNASIVVDFNQHGFMSKLKEGSPIGGTIHYLMTPEVVNDPAGKPSIFDKTVFNFDSGVKMISYVQTTPTTTEYTPFNKNSTEFSNNFFSNYNFSLSPVQQKFEKGNISKLNTSLTVTFNDGSKPYVNTITDSKKQNSINSLTGYVMGLINKLSKPLDKFNFNSKLQQKRGGDWFQALSCLSVNNKSYSSLLPDKSRNVDFSGPVYLVTHDRIALGYALMNGVNVIYLANNKDTYVFKNRNDKIVKANSVPIEQSIHREFVKFIKQAQSAAFSDYKDFQDKYDVYNKTRTFILSKCQTEFNMSINDATTFLDDPKNKLLSPEYWHYRDAFKQKILPKIKSIFKTALLYSFVLQNLPDIDDKYNFIVAFLGPNGENFSLAFNDTMGPDLLKIREFKSFISDSAFERLGPGGISRGSEDQSAENIKTNLSKALDKMDVSSAIDTLFSSQKKGITDSISSFIERVKNCGSKEQPQVYEQYIFLKFITNMPLEQLSLIVDFFEQKFIPIITKYGENLETYHSSRKRPTKPSDEEKSVFFRPANFASEVILILKPFYKSADTYKIPFKTETIDLDGDGFKVLVLNESTDNVLTVTDSISRNINTQIKQSDALDYTEQMGGGLSVFNDPSKRTSGIVYDSNINQIIWDLMGSKINDNNNYFDNIFDYITFMVGDTLIQRNDTDNFIQNFLGSNYTNEEIKGYINELMAKKAEQTQSEEYIPNDQIQNIILLILFIFFTDNRSSGSLGGGANDIRISLKQIDNKAIDNKVILRDNLFCYHPLLPIYINLTSFYNQIGPDFNGDPFYDTYIKYVNVLEKMTDILISNYLSDDLQKNTGGLQKNIEAFLIGYSLKTIFFTSNKNKSLFTKLKTLLNLDDNQARLFTMKNDIFGGEIVGNYVIDDGDYDEIIGNLLMSTSLVSRFINDEVNLSQIILAELNQEQLPIDDVNDSSVYTSKLKSQINNILNKIVNKISIDRTGNPANLSIPEGVGLDVPMDISEPVTQGKKRRIDESQSYYPPNAPSYKKFQPSPPIPPTSQFKPIPMKTGLNTYSNPMDWNFNNSMIPQYRITVGGTRKNNRKRKNTRRPKKSNKKRSIKKIRINKHKKTRKN